MSWKIVRDRNEAWCRAHGVSGQWRPCLSPLESLTQKLFEEYGEWVHSHDPGELWDLSDVIARLIEFALPRAAFLHDETAVISEPPPDLLSALGKWADTHNIVALYHARDHLSRLLAEADPHSDALVKHSAKVVGMGGFEELIEWSPVPALG